MQRAGLQVMSTEAPEAYVSTLRWRASAGAQGDQALRFACGMP